MKLGILCEGIGSLLNPESGNLVINHITHDSRLVQSGSLFVAIQGQQHDGHLYTAAACQLGAVAAVTDREEHGCGSLPWVKVDDARAAMARLSRRLYDHPERKLKTIGVTGTHGKTTSIQLLGTLLAPLGRIGRMGTLNVFNGESEERATRTTPESSELYRTLSEMVGNACSHVALEVSSHAISYGRVDGLPLQYGIFTNLDADHLDFHGDMEAYFNTKKALFDHLDHKSWAIINRDDSYGKRLYDSLTCQRFSFGRHPDCDLRFDHEQITPRGSQFRVHYQGQTLQARTQLLSEHNIYNILGSMSVALLEGIPLDALLRHVDSLKPVPGRMEPVDAGQDYQVILDSAHSGAAMSHFLRACRTLTSRRLIVVRGVHAHPEAIPDADMTIVTAQSHNAPDIKASQHSSDEHTDHVVPNRAKAIALALKHAQAGDLVSIAGGGRHMDPLPIGQDDREVTINLLKNRKGNHHVSI